MRTVFRMRVLTFIPRVLSWLPGRLASPARAPLAGVSSRARALNPCRPLGDDRRPGGWGLNPRSDQDLSVTTTYGRQAYKQMGCRTRGGAAVPPPRAVQSCGERRVPAAAASRPPDSSSEVRCGSSRRAISRQVFGLDPRKHWRSDWPSKVSDLGSSVPSRWRPRLRSMSSTTDTLRLDLAGDARSVHGHPRPIDRDQDLRIRTTIGRQDHKPLPCNARRGAAETKRASVLGLAAISPPHPSRSHPGSAVPPPQLRHHPRPANPGQSLPPSETPDQDLQSRGTIGRQAHEPSDARREAA